MSIFQCKYSNNLLSQVASKAWHLSIPLMQTNLVFGPMCNFTWLQLLLTPMRELEFARFWD